MSENKILLNHGVITCGNGSRRVVLDYESNLIYQYHDPENVLGYYAKGKGWVLRKRPYYHTSGWGNPSSGDPDGGIRIENARRLLNSINARVYEINHESFFTPKELALINKAIKKQNQLARRQNALSKQFNFAKIGMPKVDELKRIEFTLCRHNQWVEKTKATMFKGLDAVETAKKYKDAVNVFLEQKGKTLKIDGYTISKDLVTQGNNGGVNRRIVAFRDSQGQVFMNSEVLELSNFEKSFMGSQSLIQAEIRKVAKYSVPFNVLESANLKLNETKILEQGPESKHMIKDVRNYGELVERHFTGALLLENAGRKFLMDIDRIEIENKLFNAFFVEVKKDVKTIVEAYESMKPYEVKQAESQGIEVKRQGEWFFIKTDKTITVPSENIMTWRAPNENDENAPKQYVLKRAIAHGKGRPNNLFKPVGFGDLDNLVCGTVSHQGREHADLNLGETKVVVSGSRRDGDEMTETTFDLWQVVPNTTVGNFTITGDID